MKAQQESAGPVIRKTLGAVSLGLRTGEALNLAIRTNFGVTKRHHIEKNLPPPLNLTQMKLEEKEADELQKFFKEYIDIGKKHLPKSGVDWFDLPKEMRVKPTNLMSVIHT